MGLVVTVRFVDPAELPAGHHWLMLEHDGELTAVVSLDAGFDDLRTAYDAFMPRLRGETAA